MEKADVESMGKTIQIEVKVHYGVERFYPICDTGKVFAQLTNSKTLSDDSLRLIKQLGYDIEVKQPKYSF